MLARIALRIAAVEALKGRTLVADNVLDSEIGALDIAADGTIRTNRDGPFIAVFADGSKYEGHSPDLRSLYQSGLTDLVIEFGIAETMVETDKQTDASRIIGVGIPAADAAIEFTLDMVGRQIADALSDINSAWADIWRSLCYRVVGVQRARASSNDGTRVAAQQIKLSVELIDDPLRGDLLEEGTPFFEFLAALEAKTIPNPAHDQEDPDSPETLPDAIAVAKAALMRAQITGTDEPWEAAQRRLGLTRGELLALGLGPIAGDLERSTPAFAGASIDVGGVGPVQTVEA